MTEHKNILRNAILINILINIKRIKNFLEEIKVLFLLEKTK